MAGVTSLFGGAEARASIVDVAHITAPLEYWSARTPDAIALECESEAATPNLVSRAITVRADALTGAVMAGGPAGFTKLLTMPEVLGQEIGSDELYQQYLADRTRADIAQRALADQMVEANMHSRQLTSTVTLSFDYLPVTVTQPWLDDTFLSETHWNLPRRSRGELASGDGRGRLGLRVVGFAAVRNVVVSGSWSVADQANAAAAALFGPFRVNPSLGDGTMRSGTIQILGWVLERLPVLPPQPSAPT